MHLLCFSQEFYWSLSAFICAVGLLGLAVGLKAEVAHPPGLIHDLQNHLAPIRGHDLALAPDHDRIHAPSPGRVQWAESWEQAGWEKYSSQG